MQSRCPCPVPRWRDAHPATCPDSQRRRHAAFHLSADVVGQVDALWIEIDRQNLRRTGEGCNKREHAVIGNASRVQALAVILDRGVRADEPELVYARL